MGYPVTMPTTLLDRFEIAPSGKERPHEATLVDPYEIRERIHPEPRHPGVGHESWRRARAWCDEPT